MGINPQTIAHIAARAGAAEAKSGLEIEMFNRATDRTIRLAALERVGHRRIALAHMALTLALDPMNRTGHGLDYASAALEALSCMDAVDAACEARGAADEAKAAHDKPCETCGGKDQSSHARDCSVMAGLLAEAAK